MKNGSRLILMATAFLLDLLSLVCTSYGAGGHQESQALADVQLNSHVSITSATGLRYGILHDGKWLDVFFTNDTTKGRVGSIYFTFQFDSTTISIDGLDTAVAHGYHNFSSADAVMLVDSMKSWVMVKIEGFDSTNFNNTKMFGLRVKSDCLPEQTSKMITVADGQNPPAGAYCYFILSGTSVARSPDKRDTGYVSLAADSSWIFFGTTVAESTYVGGQVKVPVKFWSNFAPQDSFGAVIQYDAQHLQYDSVSVVGAWASSGVNVSQNQDTIRISKGDNSLPLPSSPYSNLAFIYWTAKDGDTLKATYSIQILKRCAYACVYYGDSTGTSSSSIKIHDYNATYDLEEITVGKNLNNVRLPLLLKNNFPILTRYGDDGTTSGIGWHIYPDMDNSYTSWQRIRTPDTVTFGGSVVMRWTDTPDEYYGGHIIQTSSACDSVEIPYNPSTYDTLAHAEITTGNLNGTDHYYLMAEDWDATWIHKDCYLKPSHGVDKIYGYSPQKITMMDGSVTVYQSSGCPYLYAWDGERFSEENTILGHSANTSLATTAIDYYRLQTPLQPKNGMYALQIREFEKEESRFDDFDLRMIDHLEGTTASVARNGDIRVFQSELYAYSATDDEGVDHVTEIFEEDGVFFKSDKPGSLTITFLTGKNFNWETMALTDEPPPPTGKEYPPQAKRAVTNAAPSSDPVITEILSSEGRWVRLDSVSNRTTEYTDMAMVRPSHYLRDGKLIIRQRWDSSRYADKISFMLPAKERPVEFKLTLEAATHSADGNILTRVSDRDHNMATLDPGETIELQFTDPVSISLKPGYVRDFVFSASGYYTAAKGVAAVPETYQLEQNYPNPFNPSTTIYYNLITTTNVNLTIFNMLGQKIKTVVDGLQVAGRQSATWDGTDESGREVASGIYLYKLTTPDYSASRKMMLIK